MTSTTVSALGVSITVDSRWAADYAHFAASPRSSGTELGTLDRAATLQAFTGAAIDQTSLYCVHAAVVHCPTGAIAFPGRSGLGKSNLALALTQAGFGYLSDEVLAVDPADGAVDFFPRAVGVDSRTLARLGLTVVEGESAGAADTDREVIVAPDSVGHVGPPRSELAAVVVAVREGTHPAGLTPTTPEHVAGQLLEHSFNHYRSPVDSIRTVAGVARGVSAWTLHYADARDAAGVLAATFL
ncbi:hypothetical protein [uncultured Jatrophihabitans sp.]|uniref:hypothetical protein n=1 Tax=uncultured Jatrophihabitans sp. TaxID=1610747 RepID=UPI0035CBF58E